MKTSYSAFSEDTYLKVKPFKCRAGNKMYPKSNDSFKHIFKCNLKELIITKYIFIKNSLL